MPTPRQMLCAEMFLEYSRYSKSGIAALVGNFTQESGINLPTAFRTSGLDHGSQGLAQWRDSRTHKRLTNYQNFVKAIHPGISEGELWGFYGRLEYQVKFTVHEMKTDFPGIHNKLQLDTGVIELTDLICWQYERPSKQYADLANRRKHAKAVYEAMKVNARPAPMPKVAEKVAQDAERRAGTAVVAGAGIGVLSWFGSLSWPIILGLAALVLIIIFHAVMERNKAKLEIPETKKLPDIDLIVDRVLEALDERAKIELSKGDILDD